MKSQGGGRLAAGGANLLAGSKLNVDLGVTVLISTGVPDRVGRVALVEGDRAEAACETRDVTKAAGDLATGGEGQEVVGVHDRSVRRLNLAPDLEGGDVTRREEVHGSGRARSEERRVGKECRS